MQEEFVDLVPDYLRRRDQWISGVIKCDNLKLFKKTLKKILGETLLTNKVQLAKVFTEQVIWYHGEKKCFAHNEILDVMIGVSPPHDNCLDNFVK